MRYFYRIPIRIFRVSKNVAFPKIFFALQDVIKYDLCTTPHKCIEFRLVFYISLMWQNFMLSPLTKVRIGHAALYNC